MAIATVTVFVDSAQQAEEQVRVARDVANKSGASIIGVSAFAIEPPLVAEGVIVQETTADDAKRMKAALAGKEEWFRAVLGLPKDRVEWRWALEYPTTFLANEACFIWLWADREFIPNNRFRLFLASARLWLVERGPFSARRGGADQAAVHLGYCPERQRHSPLHRIRLAGLSAGMAASVGQDLPSRDRRMCRGDLEFAGDDWRRITRSEACSHGAFAGRNARCDRRGRVAGLYRRSGVACITSVFSTERQRLSRCAYFARTDPRSGFKAISRVDADTIERDGVP